MRLVRFLTAVILSVLALIIPTSTYAGDVESACSSDGPTIVHLKYRNGAENRKSIQAAALGESELAKSLSEIARRTEPLTQRDREKLSPALNQRLIPDSKFKTSFLRFSTEDEKMKDPKEYRKTLLDAVARFVPKKFVGPEWFLNFKAAHVSSTSIEPTQESLGEFYGAMFRARPEPDGRHRFEIIFSNNASEPIPYLVPLIIHEVQHASSFAELAKIPQGRKRTEARLIDEAKAFDLQMQAYVAIAKENPRLFCDWVYPTWAYGDVLVPLSWTMASMEAQLLSGEVLLNYVKEGPFKGSTFLLTEDQTKLRSDIRERIAQLKLKYVR